jgi:hypothetical protein
VFGERVRGIKVTAEIADPVDKRLLLHVLKGTASEAQKQQASEAPLE